MTRHPLGWRQAAGCAILLLLAACRSARVVPIDRDRDGLDDRTEAELARQFLPTLHESGGAAGPDHCSWPTPRPALFRAHPRAVPADLNTVAITYVLLYAEDCGALAHAGDDEAFTVLVSRDPGTGQWRRVGAEAVAHRGMPGERGSTGAGDAIWISRDKHSAYATYESCNDDDWFADTCTRDGPSPASVVLLNAGEPFAPLADDVGDAILAAGADANDARAMAPWLTGTPDADGQTRLLRAIGDTQATEHRRLALTYLLFRGQHIWSHGQFLGAGNLAAQLTDEPRAWTHTPQ